MVTTDNIKIRWQDYILNSSTELIDFWKDHLGNKKRDVLFVLGRGFDSRMCLGLETLVSTNKVNKLEVLAINLDEGANSPSQDYLPNVEENWQKLEDIVEDKATIIQKDVTMWSEDGRRIGSRSAGSLFTKIEDLSEFTDIIVDISAMPRSIYIPLIGSILYILDNSEKQENKIKINLHIWVSENPVLDSAIHDQEIEESASFIHGFGGKFELEATANVPSIWIPVLGEGQLAQMERIYDRVQPDEICPVLPSPSSDPRRGDNLILEYRELLFDSLRIEPRNYIYADEQNPFEVYRQIRRTILHYQKALEPLGGCKTVISALSSKLMSLGTLLVAYELKQVDIDVGIAHIESNGYKIGCELDEDAMLNNNQLFGIWLYGECYEYQ